MNGKAENEKSLLINDECTRNFQSFELINVEKQLWQSSFSKQIRQFKK